MVRERRFWPPQVFCFRKAAGVFFPQYGLSILALLSRLCCAAFYTGFVLPWSTTFTDCGSRAIASAFAAAPFTRLSLARETHWSKNLTTPITNRVDKDAVFLEKLAALFPSQVHSVSCRPNTRLPNVNRAR